MSTKPSAGRVRTTYAFIKAHRDEYAVQTQIYRNRELAVADVADYIITFYNRTRRHSHLGGVGPEQFEEVHKQRRPPWSLAYGGRSLPRTRAANVIRTVKVLTQDDSGPLVLSRRFVAVAASVLPARLVRRVARLLVVGETAAHEPFTYDAERRLARLCVPGDGRDPEARDLALRELLRGFARLDSGPADGVPLTDLQRQALEAFVNEWHPRCLKAIAESGNKPRAPHARRVMYIESKVDGLSGPARIGWVTYSKSGRSLEYRGRRFLSLSGRGFKANYFEEESGDRYWISGCKQDGTDALYGSPVIEVDEDARDEYWTAVRGLPGLKTQASFRSIGKYPE